MVAFLSFFLILVVFSFDVNCCCGPNVEPTIETTTLEYPGWVACYSYDTGFTICFETAKECEDIGRYIIGYGYDEECSNRQPQGYIRCVDTHAPFRVCRPYEAGCASWERQQPSDSDDRYSGVALKVVSETLTECLSYQPLIRCVPVTPNFTICQHDVMDCSEDHVQVPSNLYFSTPNECLFYSSPAYIRCENETDSSDVICHEYDPLSLSECPLPGYNRIPDEKVFPSQSNCLEALPFDVFFVADWDPTVVFCLKSDTSDGVKIKEMNTYDLEECQSYKPQWNRWINTTSNDVLCLPVSEVDENGIDPPDTFELSQHESFEDFDSCLATQFYIRCLHESSNQLYCVQDSSGCLKGARTSSADLYTSWTTCIVPDGYKKCVNYVTGEIVCRPNPDNCIPETELWLGSSNSSQVADCETSTIQYYRCYKETGEQVCRKDYTGCLKKTRMLDNPELTSFFDSYESCENSTVFDWYRCYEAGGKDGFCRPQSCELGEFALQDGPSPTIFSNHSLCYGYDVENWVGCQDGGEILCRPDGCVTGETNTGVYNYYENCTSALA